MWLIRLTRRRIGLSVFHLVGRGIFGPLAAPVIQACGADVGVTQPHLHFGDVGVMFQIGMDALGGHGMQR